MVSAGDSEAPTIECHDGDVGPRLPHLSPQVPCSLLLFQSSSSSPLTSVERILKKMTRDLFGIWKEEVSQAGPIPPRVGK